MLQKQHLIGYSEMTPFYTGWDSVTLMQNVKKGTKDIRLKPESGLGPMTLHLLWGTLSTTQKKIFKFCLDNVRLAHQISPL